MQRCSWYNRRMLEKVKDVHPPRGLARLGLRTPIWLYRLGLGGLLGQRFLLLNHMGRKSGKVRQSVVEVVDRNTASGAFVVASGFGDKADWYKNVMAHPNVTIQVGRQQIHVHAERLPPMPAAAALLEYNRRHPKAMQTLARFMGYRIDGSEADVRKLASEIPVLVLTPLDSLREPSP